MRMPATPDAARRETSINEEVSVLNLSRAHMLERRDWYHLQLAKIKTAPVLSERGAAGGANSFQHITRMVGA